MGSRFEKVHGGGCQRHNCDGCRSWDKRRRPPEGGDCPLMTQTKGRCKMRTKKHFKRELYSDDNEGWPMAGIQPLWKLDKLQDSETNQTKPKISRYSLPTFFHAQGPEILVIF